MRLALIRSRPLVLQNKRNWPTLLSTLQVTDRKRLGMRNSGCAGKVAGAVEINLINRDGMSADKNILKHLLPRARQHKISAREHREQDISFILGNSTIEGVKVHRGTVTRAVPQIAMDPARLIGSMSVGLDDPQLPFDVNGAVRQIQLVKQLIATHAEQTEPLQFTPALIQQIHAEAGVGIESGYGAFRKVEVYVNGSPHRPPSPDHVEVEVAAFCRDLNDNWKSRSPLYLGAFALWRLNWIHPFRDGNGRTARALCYLVLSLKFGMLLPGTATLVEQLNARRAEYFDALSVADLSYANKGKVDLTPLEDLIETLLVRQLRGLPSLSDRVEAAVDAVFARRVLAADAAKRASLYGTDQVGYRLWASGDCLVVHIASYGSIQKAERLAERAGRPFPSLLADRGEPASLTLDAQQRGVIVRLCDFKKPFGGAVLRLKPNAAAILESLEIEDTSTEVGWSVGGSLYVLQRGEQLTDLWVIDILDLLISRHFRAAP